MRYVRKENKCLSVNDADVDGYLADGYDEIDEKGKVIKTSPTKTYSAAEVAKIMADYEAQIKELRAKLPKSKKSDYGESEKSGNGTSE